MSMTANLAASVRGTVYFPRRYSYVSVIAEAVRLERFRCSACGSNDVRVIVDSVPVGLVITATVCLGGVD